MQTKILILCVAILAMLTLPVDAVSQHKSKLTGENEMHLSRHEVLPLLPPLKLDHDDKGPNSAQVLRAYILARGSLSVRSHNSAYVVDNIMSEQMNKNCALVAVGAGVSALILGFMTSILVFQEDTKIIGYRQDDPFFETPIYEYNQPWTARLLFTGAVTGLSAWGAHRLCSR